MMITEIEFRFNLAVFSHCLFDLQNCFASTYFGDDSLSLQELIHEGLTDELGRRNQRDPLLKAPSLLFNVYYFVNLFCLSLSLFYCFVHFDSAGLYFGNRLHF